MIGSQLAQCRIIEKIGAGGMSEIYPAEDPKLDRNATSKVLPEEFINHPERLANQQR